MEEFILWAYPEQRSHPVPATTANLLVFESFAHSSQLCLKSNFVPQAMQVKIKAIIWARLVCIDTNGD